MFFETHISIACLDDFFFWGVEMVKIFITITTIMAHHQMQVVMERLKILSQYVTGGTEEGHEKTSGLIGLLARV
jgi:hypothetical protein